MPSARIQLIDLLKSAHQLALNQKLQCGRIKTECGRPEITPFTEGRNECGRRRACNFVIKQKIEVEIPISYEVDTDIGESFVDCNAQ